MMLEEFRDKLNEIQNRNVKRRRWKLNLLNVDVLKGCTIHCRAFPTKTTVAS